MMIILIVKPALIVDELMLSAQRGVLRLKYLDIEGLKG